MINPYNKTVASNKENLTTEIFHDLLHCGPLRRILLELFGLRSSNENIIDDFRFSDVKTQVRLKEVEADSGGQPDLVIKNKSCTLFIEIKVSKNCPLQDSQPCRYLEDLEESSKKDFNENDSKKVRGCYFLLPRGYDHKSEILTRYEKWLKVNPGSQIKHKIVYWEDLLEKIDKAEIYNQQLTWFCEKIGSWMSYEVVSITEPEIILAFDMEIECDTENNKFNQQEINMAMMSPIPSIYKKFKDLARSVAEELKKKEVPCRYANGEDYWMIERDGCTLGFGVWEHFWREKGKPISIYLREDTSEDHKEKFKEICKNENLACEPHCESNTYLTTWIPREMFLCENSVEKIAEHIQLFYNALK